MSVFRGSRQQQADRNALPKGHIIGWVPKTPDEQKGDGKAQSKNAAKKAKRRAKKRSEKEEPVRDNWEDDDDEEEVTEPKKQEADKGSNQSKSDVAGERHARQTPSPPANENTVDGAEALSKGIEKLDVS